jgi:hypothetical protein
MEKIELNANFDERASVHGAMLEWQASPMKGVERRMLERIGDEVARATTIVRYAPGSKFSSHVHTGGEEFLVLDGVFQDEHGDFPKGSYIRNPPQSEHTPGSDEGCTILVKLWQFEASDRTHVVTDTSKQALQPVASRDNVGVMPLFNDGREDVRLEKWDGGATIAFTPKGGVEVFVIDGGFAEGGETFSEQSWLRLPVGTKLEAKAGSDGCLCWIKEGHLSQLDSEAFATKTVKVS